ncbi:MAG: hypothetical protein HW421_743 [Ignavibacteria bacterium]|nr:hypothetical protein [Ignavibacteria bacterium]
MEEEKNEIIPNEQKESEGLNFFANVKGIITSPSATFESIAKHKLENVDYFIPLVLFSISFIITIFIILNDPKLREEYLPYKNEQIKKELDLKVKKGELSQKEADSISETMNDNENGIVKNSMHPIFIVYIIGGTFFIVVIGFLIFSYLFMLFVRYALGGSGSFHSSMVAFSMPLYIVFIDFIIFLLYYLFTNQIFVGINLAFFFNIDINTFTGGILSIIDLVDIWYLYVFSVGYAKLFKSGYTKKYVITFMGIWLTLYILIIILRHYFPTVGW